MDNPKTGAEKLKVLKLIYGMTIGTNEGKAIVNSIATSIMIVGDDGKKTLSTEDRDSKASFWFTEGNGGIREVRLNEIEIYKGVGWQVKFLTK